MATKTRRKLECEATDDQRWDGLSPEILDMIFHHLPVPDLLSCSVVSSNWKKASRDVLKRSRECYAHIKYFHQDLQDLNHMILSTDLMQMVNGLHIRHEEDEWLESTSPPYLHDSSRSDSDFEPEDPLQDFQDKMLKMQDVLSAQWRYFHLDLRSKKDLTGDDAALVKELFCATSNSLEKLTMAEDLDWGFIPSSCEKEFPNLKTIETLTSPNLQYPYLAKFLKKYAPNLKEFTGAVTELEVNWPMDCFIFMLERIKSVSVCPAMKAPEGELKEAFQLVSGLHRLDLQHYHLDCSDPYSEEHNLEAWNSFVFSFVLRSLNTLVELRMYFMEFYNLCKTSDELKLPNLQRLSLATHWNASKENDILALKQLNLPKLCPKLQQLELPMADVSYCRVEESVTPIELPDELDKSNLPMLIEFECRDLNCFIYEHDYVDFLKSIYPKINKVRIYNWGQDDYFQMSNLFSDLPSLEYLEIDVVDHPLDVHFRIDALLSGIDTEDAKLPSISWRAREKAKSSIKPIRPSLFEAKSLQELKITQHADHDDIGDMVSHSWVTRITENLPVRHVRNLKVTFEGSVRLYNALNRSRALPACCPSSGVPKFHARK